MSGYNPAAPLKSLHLFFFILQPLLTLSNAHVHIYTHWKLHASLSTVSYRLQIHLAGGDITVEHIFSMPPLKLAHTCH